MKSAMGNTTTIRVKGMICHRCIITVQDVLNKIGARVNKIQLGEVELLNEPSFSINEARQAITGLGFEILVDRQIKMVEQVKQIVQELLNGDEHSSQRFSSLLSERIKISYDAISSVFSAREGISLEQYIIREKIERVKKLLTDSDLSLTEISFRTNYSSVHHLSRQFKEKMGMNPSEYRNHSRSNNSNQDYEKVNSAFII